MSSTSEYLVGPTIGEGGFAHVVYAKHKKSGKRVAIKVMEQITLKRRPEIMQMVLTERAVLKQLDSSYIVNLWASFYDSQCVYLVMELVVGGDLHGLIQHGLSMESKERWHSSIPFYCQQLIQAVKYIHSKKILHCDLKPQNILCDGQGGLKLADFATAMAMDMMHATLVPRGTSEYSCPELLRSELNLTAAVDFWSLGCIFYAMFQNESPFHAESEALAVELVMEYTEKAAYFSQLTQINVSDEWSCIIDGLLQVRPTARTQAWNDIMSKAIGWEKPNDLLKPKASWQEEVQSANLKDGSLGWAVFEL
jgi:serine/threonine protein kinase